MNGKGSKRRPTAIKHEQFAAHWEAVFGKKDIPDLSPEDRKLVEKVSKMPLEQFVEQQRMALRKAADAALRRKK